MDLSVRDDLARNVLETLAQAAPGSIALLRGSLASGQADEYSDIDVLWEVPDSFFPDAVGRVRDTLSAIAPLESLRSDPAFQRSDRRRLFFARFMDVPLFWRLDLDVLARSVGRDAAYDRDNPEARGSAWSPTESALMNVVAAVKAYHRHDDQRALQLLQRGYERVGIQLHRASLHDQLLELTEGIAILDPDIGPLVTRIISVIDEAFPAGACHNNSCPKSAR